MKQYCLFRAFAVSLFVGVPSACYAQPRCATEDRPPKLFTSFAIPESNNGSLVVAVEIKRRRLFAVVDTGAAFSVYDTSLRDSLGEPAGVTLINTHAGKREMPLFRSPVLAIGKINIDGGSENVGCADLASLRRNFNFDIRVVIGMDVLQKFVLTVDFPRHRLSLCNEPPEVDEDSHSVPIKYIGGTPWVLALFGAPAGSSYHSVLGSDQGAWFQIDTGCVTSNSGSISGSLFDRLSRRGAVKLLGREVIAALDREVMAETGEFVPILVVGKQGYAAVQFTRGEYCCLGIGFLSGHVACLDFPRSVAYLKLQARELKSSSHQVGSEARGAGAVQLEVNGGSIHAPKEAKAGPERARRTRAAAGRQHIQKDVRKRR